MLRIFSFLAHDEGERFVGGQRILSRNSLVSTAVWHWHQQNEVRRLRLRWRRVEILPWWRRVLDNTVYLESSAQSEVSFDINRRAP